MRPCLIAFLALFISTAAFAQPLADRVPADALVYIGWQGSQSLDGYSGSHLQAIVDSSDLPKVFSEWVPLLIQRLGQSEPQAAGVMQLIATAGGHFWKHPSALYFAGVDLTNPNNPIPKLAIICDAGNEADAIVASLNAAMTKIGVLESPAKITLHNNRFVCVTFLSEPAAELTALLNGKAQPDASLAGRAEFKKALAQTPGRAAAVAYVDIQSLVKSLQKFGIGNMIDAGALSGTTQAILTLGFEGKDWVTQWYMGIAPGHVPREKPLTDQLLKSIPKSVYSMAAVRFDLSALFNQLHGMMSSADPEFSRAIDQGIGIAKAMTGVNIQTDLFDALGDEWAIYTDPSVGGGSGLLSVVMINRPRDSKKLEESLEKLELFISNMATMGMQHADGQLRLSFRQAKVGDLNIHYLAVPVVAPAWAVKDGNIYFAFYPQVLASAAKIPAAGSSILDNDKYQAMKKRLGGQAPVAVSFSDLPRTIGPAYANLMMVTRFVQGMSDLFGIDAPPMLIPPLDVLERHVSIAGSTSWIDAAGWHGKSLSPYPGAEFVGTEVNSVIAEEALLVSIMLPALNSAKERANRVKCASNMRQMGQGLMLYANDHKGKYPPNLGVLVTEADINPEVFICPSGNTAGPPAGVFDRAGIIKNPDKVVAWVNEHSDYVFVGGALNGNSPADLIVVYEKPGAHGGQGINILFNDGHVEWMPMPAALKLIQEQVPGFNNQQKPKPPKRGDL
jgi:prepilin-type processing-associated H-X9-DG protein